MEFTKDLFCGSVSLRWFNCNCYQIKLPNGKTVITDPFMPTKDHPMEKWHKYDRGFSIEDLGSADYAIVGHPHADHIGSLPELFDMYAPRVLCHSVYAIRLTLDLKIPQQMIFPFDNNQHYEFNDFTLDTIVARHGPGYVGQRPEKNRIIDPDTVWEEMNMLGALYNTNYILTTKNNIRIAFCAGFFDDVEKNNWKDKYINILLRQCGNMDNDPEVCAKAAEDMMVTGAEIMLPIHHERFSSDIVISFADRVNKILADRGYHGRMIAPECGKWYDIGMAVRER